MIDWTDVEYANECASKALSFQSNRQEAYEIPSYRSYTVRDSLMDHLLYSYHHSYKIIHKTENMISLYKGKSKDKIGNLYQNSLGVWVFEQTKRRKVLNRQFFSARLTMVEAFKKGMKSYGR